MSWPADLAAEWRDEARRLRERHGAHGRALTMKACANDLEEWWQVHQTEPLTLDEAAAESGYTVGHLSRLISDGVLPNMGESYAPRLCRADLPRKPGHEVGHQGGLDAAVSSRTQMARSVVESE